MRSLLKRATLKTPAESATYESVVSHGATAGTARPAGATAVLWRGTVAPTNAILNDTWLDTSTSPATPKRHNGTTFESIGGGLATTGVTRIVALTQSAYNALTVPRDATILYAVTPD